MSSKGSGRGGGGMIWTLIGLGLVVWFVVDYEGFEVFATEMANRFVELVSHIADMIEVRTTGSGS